MNLKIRVINNDDYSYHVFNDVHECVIYYNIDKADVYMLLSYGNRCLFHYKDSKLYFMYIDDRQEYIMYKEQKHIIYSKCNVCEKLSLNTFNCCLPCYMVLL